MQIHVQNNHSKAYGIHYSIGVCIRVIRIVNVHWMEILANSSSIRNVHWHFRENCQSTWTNLHKFNRYKIILFGIDSDQLKCSMRWFKCEKSHGPPENRLNAPLECSQLAYQNRFSVVVKKNKTEFPSIHFKRKQNYLLTSVLPHIE